VVIVGGMGSIPGAAIGALIIGLSEQLGLVYAPTYSVVFTFLIMAAVLAFRPQGLLGQGARSMALAEISPDRIRPRGASPRAGSSAPGWWWALGCLLLTCRPMPTISSCSRSSAGPSSWA
jgi:hypothetical protein